MKKPCKNCPFVNTPDRITFACRERAEEIEEMAYREGFVCHLHSEYREGNDWENDGYYFNDDGNSQHCFGALAMYLKNETNNVPWENTIEEDESLEERWWSRVSKKALATVFESEEAFIEANT